MAGSALASGVLAVAAALSLGLAAVGGAAVTAQRTAGAADAAALAALDHRSRELLDAVTEQQSVRAAAARLGRHHSSVQERLTALVETLGYDPRTSRGHARYVLARMLLTLGS